MKMKIVYLFSALLCTATAWPRAHQQYSMERGLAGRSFMFSAAQQESFGKQSLCQSVVAEPTGISQDTAVHFCQQGSSVCYFSALKKCCNTQQSNIFTVRGSSNVQVGSAPSFRVNFFLSGGFQSGKPAAACFIPLDDNVRPCRTSSNCATPSCAPTTTFCAENVLSGTTCTEQGCVCEPGYLAPDCCECDTTGVQGQQYYEENGLCKPICFGNCTRRTPRGCAECLPGFQGRGCCECAGDLVGPDCTCPPGQIQGTQNRCFRCPEGQVLNERDQCVCPQGGVLHNGRCVACPPPKVLRNGVCRSIIPCGENQDIIFVLDISQSFTVENFRKVIFALENIFDALKMGVNINVGLVLYPYIRGLEYRESSVNISFSDSCITGVENLEKIAMDMFSSEYQSEGTRSYEAIEFIGSERIVGDKPTAVVTVTDGRSDITAEVPDPLSRVRAAISEIRKDKPSTRFFAAGVMLADTIPLRTVNEFKEELLALGEGMNSHYFLIQRDIARFIDRLLDLLVEGNMLCPRQKITIQDRLGAGENSPLVEYPRCVKRRVFLNKPKKCYQENLCGGNAPGMSSLEMELLKAVEEVLQERLQA